MTRITDSETGLALALVPGWKPLDLPGIALAAAPRHGDAVFTPSLIATVSSSDGRSLDDIVVTSTAEWLASTPSAMVIDGHEIEGPIEGAQFRIVHGVYSLGITSVALVSVLVLGEQDVAADVPAGASARADAGTDAAADAGVKARADAALLVRLDLSVPATQAAEATGLLHGFAESMTMPHTASSERPPGSVQEFAERLNERGS